ncbi:MAG: hypothetical protein AB1758_11610 [Candidatus Eremiobacterota bacterium]
MHGGYAFVTRHLSVRGQPSPPQAVVLDLCLSDNYYRVRHAVSSVLSLTLMGQIVYPSLYPLIAGRMGAFAGASRQPIQAGSGQPYRLCAEALARGFGLGILGLLGPAREDGAQKRTEARGDEPGA